MKKIIKAAILLILVLLLIVGIYVGYVLTSWHRIEDNQKLQVNKASSETTVPAGEKIKIMTYNIGFGAYLQDYSFFMDGGTESRAESRQSVEENIDNIVSYAGEQNADICLFQEVDRPSTRTHQVDEMELILASDEFAKYDSTYAVNYDSPYLFYPLTEPHGQNNSGIITLSKYNIDKSVRRSLPIDDSLAKLVDLDRCYSKNYIKTSEGKNLVIFNLHLSAYTVDKSIANNQLKMLYEDISQEYNKGNYIIAGGDFNKDLIGNSSKTYGIGGDKYSWCQPFVTDDLPEFMKLINGFDEKNPVPSCRNCDEPWNEETTFRANVDGYLVSDNIQVIGSYVDDIDFLYSDHNPVYMNVILK